MKTLTIGDTIYNLAYLIRIQYKAKTREPKLQRGKSAATSSSSKSASSLELHFLDCDTIHLKKDKADAVWHKLSVLLDLDPEETPSEPEIPTPS